MYHNLWNIRKATSHYFLDCSSYLGTFVNPWCMRASRVPTDKYSTPMCISLYRFVSFSREVFPPPPVSVELSAYADRRATTFQIVPQIWEHS
jgi:hypothetical protein